LVKKIVARRRYDTSQAIFTAEIREPAEKN
jgi:hypothetical protein